MAYYQLMAEGWLVSLNPGRFRMDEARMQVLARTVGIMGDLEVQAAANSALTDLAGDRPATDNTGSS